MYQSEETREADAIMGSGVKWALVLAAGLTLLGFVGWGMHTAGLFGETVIERKVFENSYQYSEARKTEIATLEAQLVEIDGQLADPDLDASAKRSLESQKSVIKVRLNAAKSKNENVLLK